jgi:diguanylate cyclase (GGDEF)-like protein/PAS domain S-box-containing protein
MGMGDKGSTDVTQAIAIARWTSGVLTLAFVVGLMLLGDRSLSQAQPTDDDTPPLRLEVVLGVSALVGLGAGILGLGIQAQAVQAPKNPGKAAQKKQGTRGRLPNFNPKDPAKDEVEPPVFEHLLASMDELRQLADSLPQAFWVVQLEPLRHLYVNHAYETIFGASRESLYRDSYAWFTYVIPEDQDQLAQFLERQRQTGESLSLEFRIVNGQGQHRWLSARVFVMADGQGRPFRSIGIAEDITANKQAELALRKSEERWQFALEGNEDGIWDWDLATGTIFYSARWKTMLGYNETDLGTDLSEWIDRLHPEDRDRVLRAAHHHAEGQIPKFHVEYRMRCKDGSYKWILDRGKVISRDATGQPLRIIGVHTDITARKQTELALQSERDLLNSVMNTSIAAITILDTSGQIVFANPQAEVILGLTFKDLVNRTYNSPEWRCTDLEGGPWPDHCQPFYRVITTGQPVHNVRHAIEWPDGQRRLLSINGEAVKDAEGTILYLVFNISDITDQITAEQALRQSDAHLRLIAENMSDLVCLHDPDGTFTYVSPSAEHLLGFSPAELVGQDPYQFFHPKDIPAIRQGSHQQALAGQSVPITYRMRRRDGTYIWLETLTKPILAEDNQIIGLQTTSRDVTEDVKVQAKLTYDAGHDALTGLANRTLLLDQLDARLTANSPQTSHCAVLFLDLDRFKVINDSLGHHTGDDLLVALARTLSAIVRPHDLVSRLGGDEFVVLLTEVTHPNQAIEVADRILSTLEQPIVLRDRELFVTTSIGIAVATAHYQTGAELLRDADLAMYRAKSLGKARYAMFNPAMYSQVQREMHLEEALRQAIEHQAFTLHYQPIINLVTGEISGFEALARWPHPDYGFISPAEFIPIAEETGLIIPLGQWVLRTACHQFRQWQHQFACVGTMGLSVNLSAVQMRDVHLVEYIKSLLLHSGLDSRCLTLEITESLLIDSVEYNLEVLDQLRNHGIKLSIDDFGTGYSALSYLQRFPFSNLKIDRSFVMDLGSEAENPNLVKAILALAASLGLQPVAEGVETHRQLEFLRVNGCQYGQGFLFYRPMAAPEVGQLLAQTHGGGGKPMWQDNSDV